MPTRQQVLANVLATFALVALTLAIPLSDRLLRHVVAQLPVVPAPAAFVVHDAPILTASLAR